MPRRAWPLLLAIVALAAALRSYRLESIPPGLYLDEASVGVEAHALATTGKGSHGEPPILFRALDDWKHPMYVWATAVSEAALGPTKLAVRLPAVVFGTLTVLLLALLALELTGDVRAALLAAFVLAITPWHVHYSRAWEAITLDFGLVLALWLFARAKRLGGRSRFALAGAAFGLVLYTYVTAKVLVPAFLVALALIEWRDWKWTSFITNRVLKHAESLPAPPVKLGPIELPLPRRAVEPSDVLAALTAFVLIAAPLAVVEVQHFSEIQTRFRAVSVFREESPLAAMGRSYVAHLHPVFLFVTGDANRRHGIPGLGLLLLATSPFVVVGLFRALARRTAEQLLLLAWLAIYPLGAFLTSEGIPHATRSIAAAPLFALLAASGVTVTLDRVLSPRGRAALAVIAALAFLGNAAFFFKVYFTTYAREAGPAWISGVEELVPELVARRKELRRVHFMPGPRGVALLREHILFLTRFDPELDPARPDAYFRWDDAVSWGRFLAKLPRDEALVTWGDSQWGREPMLRVFDAEGNLAFQVYRGFGGK